MPDRSKTPFQFWQELKRRKVFRVVAMYAGAAYIIIELVNNVAEPLHLPDWIATLVIILLMIGFPIVALFSWIFDITPEGIKKTEPAKGAKAKEVMAKPVKRKLRASDIIIAVLVLVVLIMIYPKIINGGGNLKAMTNNATIINEYGKEERRQVFKEEYVPKLMILPFQAEETDTINPWLKYGILEGIWEDLSQFQYFLTYLNYEAIHLQEQIKSARINNCPYFLTGTYKVTDEYYEIITRLHQTKNGSLEKERIYQGEDLFSLFDSISLQTRFDLGISKNILDSYPDLPFREHTTDNLNAYKYYILGNYWDVFSTNIFRNLSTAIEIDSTFALASYYYAWYCHFWEEDRIDAREYISHTMRHRHRLPEYRDIQARILNYSIFGEKEKTIALSEMQHELQPYNIEVLNSLIKVYDNYFLNAKSEDAIKKLNQLVPAYPEYQIKLAKSYLISDKIDEGLKFIVGISEENPENLELILIKGQLYLHNNELDNAEEAFQKAIFLSPENEENWSLMLNHINFARNNTVKPDELQKFFGKYRKEDSESCFEIVILNDHVYRKGTNQGGFFYYPISDTSFVGSYGFINFSFSINNQGEVIKLINNDDNYDLYNDIIWKQDSLISNAEKLLISNRQQEALIAFQKAYSENPDHYYLANYITHLEFIQSLGYEKLKPFLDTYTGEYGSVKIFQENDQFFLEEPSSLDFKLLPLSENQFMNPSRYYYHLEFVKEDNQITGLNAIFIDGREFFFERTTKQALID